MARRRLSKSSLHWFINSRSFAYLADIRRRFDLEAREDVCMIKTEAGSIFLGLDIEYAHLFQALYNEKKIGFELAPDIHARSVVGIFTTNSEPERHQGQVTNGNRPAITSEPVVADVVSEVAPEPTEIAPEPTSVGSPPPELPL